MMIMEYALLNTGAKMPMLGLGTYGLRGKECEKAVEEALGLGYRFFDTAQMYGNEAEIGIALAKALEQGQVSRDELFVTTKLCRPSTSYHEAKAGIVASLAALRLYYVDLLLIHEPYPEAGEMWRAFEEAHALGQARSIGVSNFNAARFRSFMRSCHITPAVNQVEAHVFFQRPDLYSILREHGCHMQAWSPLAAGRNNIFNNAALCVIGQKYGKSPAQIALRFLVQQGISVIPKSGSAERMRQNMEIFDFKLEDDDMHVLHGLDRSKSLFGWYPA